MLDFGYSFDWESFLKSCITIAFWALIPAFIALAKKRSFFAYYFLSLIITPILTLIIVLCLSPLSPQPRKSRIKDDVSEKQVFYYKGKAYDKNEWEKECDEKHKQLSTSKLLSLLSSYTNPYKPDIQKEEFNIIRVRSAASELFARGAITKERYSSILKQYGIYEPEVKEQRNNQIKAMQALNVSLDKEWLSTQKNGVYYFFCKTEGVETQIIMPNGNPLKTKYRVLANRILEDLKEYGFNYNFPESVVSYHVTLNDSFSGFKHKEIENKLLDILLPNDWTFNPSINERYKELLGGAVMRSIEIKNWLKKCSKMQLAAASCLGNAYKSINMPFCIAKMMEDYDPTYTIPLDRIKELAEVFAVTGNYDAETMVKDIRTFVFYYGIHYREKGRIIVDEADSTNVQGTDEPVEKTDIQEKTVDTNQSTPKQITVETPQIKAESVEIETKAEVIDKPSNQMPTVMFCRKCGAKLIEGSLFCNKCGTKVIDLEE